MLLVAASAAAEPAHDPPAAIIDITELTISGGGGLDPAIMRSAFDETIDTAYLCYDGVKSRLAKVNATVTLKFRIDNHGAVAKASAVGLPSVNSCLATAIKGLVFNAPNKGAIDLTEKLSFRTPTMPATPGILGSTAVEQGGAFGSLTGTGELSTGFDDTNIYGGLLDNEAGDRKGHGDIGLGGKAAHTSVPSISIGQPSVLGDLDKAIIRRYIKRNLQKFQYCYEKQLLDKPGLAGTVQTQFAIGVDGKVTSSTGTGFDATVASCVAAVIQQIEFPKPKTRSVVQVNYPFVFRPGNDDQKP